MRILKNQMWQIPTPIKRRRKQALPPTAKRDVTERTKICAFDLHKDVWCLVFTYLQKEDHVCGVRMTCSTFNRWSRCARSWNDNEILTLSNGTDMNNVIRSSIYMGRLHLRPTCTRGAIIPVRYLERICQFVWLKELTVTDHMINAKHVSSFRQLSRLKALSLIDCTFQYENDLAQLVLLGILKVFRGAALFDSAHFRILSESDTLEVLTLSDCFFLCDSALLGGNKFPALRKLDIERCDSITLDAIVEFLSNRTKLEELRFFRMAVFPTTRIRERTFFDTIGKLPLLKRVTIELSGFPQSFSPDAIAKTASIREISFKRYRDNFPCCKIYTAEVDDRNEITTWHESFCKHLYSDVN